MNEIENKQPNSARKWLITINNPIEKGFTHDAIIKKLADRTAIKYWCMADEVGNEEETFHTHVFVYAANKIRFDTMQKILRCALGCLQRYGGRKQSILVQIR